MAKARESFNKGVTRSYIYRIQQLQALLNLYTENTPLLLDALYKDLHKSKMESMISEINVLIEETKTMIIHLKEWMTPCKVHY